MNNFFYILIIIVFLFKTETVFSNNLIYDVNNIEVSGKIKNELDNKNLIDNAFQKAFIIFVNKTLLSEDALGLYKTKIGIIKNLIFTYQIVKNERKDKNNNNLTINVKFDKKKINSFLAQKRISYADVTNISLTLLPIFIQEQDVLIYTDNFFYNNWSEKKDVEEKNNTSLINYNLALENIEDLQHIMNNKENLELIDIKKITSFYNEKNYAFLIIYFTDNKFRAYIKTFIENKEVNKNIDLKIYPANTNKSYEEAILLLKKEINQIWKAQNLIDINTPSFLDLFLEINKINDYLRLISVLESIDVIENYSAIEMTNKNIKVRIKYKGKIAKIRKKLLEKKININIKDNIWILKIN